MGPAPVRLDALRAAWVRRIGENNHETINNFADADGLRMLCPKCFHSHGGEKGTHWLVCWRPRVREGAGPGAGRWEFVGTGINDVSLITSKGLCSVQLTGGCLAQFYVRHGFAELV